MSFAPPVEVAVLALWRTTPAARTEFLCARRLESAIRGGLWELPGGKMEPNEAPLDAALRELQEETGLSLRSIAMDSLREVGVVDHTDHGLTRERSVRLHVFLARALDGCSPIAQSSAEVRWIDIQDFAAYPWPGANLKVNALLFATMPNLA